MSAALQSVLDEVTLPDDLRPDDTILIYNDDGTPENEVESDDEFEADRKAYELCPVLALAYYNDLHGTDYKVVKATMVAGHSGEHSPMTHCGFTAAPSRDVDESAKHFCAELLMYTKDVVSCDIVELTSPDSCEYCYTSESDMDMVIGVDTSRRDEEDKEPLLPPLSEYCHYLADGVTLSDKAWYRLNHRFPLLALAYYNKKQRTDYKLVDVLPYCVSIESKFVGHCNFIARQSDSSNRLFFAELVMIRRRWVVKACFVVRGKTTAGCHYCAGKRVVHPTYGFVYGLYPDRPRLGRGRGRGC